MKRNPVLIALMSLIMLLGVTSVGLAQDGTPQEPTDDQVNAIARQLYCPVCENIPLDVCGTQACAQWRELIREKLSEGWGEQQIKQYFVDQYGDRVLATPPLHGLNWLIYIIPPVAFLGGAIILYRAFQSWHKPLQKPEAPGDISDSVEEEDEYIKRIEEELHGG